MAENLYTTIQFVVVSCASCGNKFCITESFKSHLQDSGQAFYCPNGHSQSYRTEASAKEQVAKATVDLERRIAALKQENERLTKAKVLTRAGTATTQCPHCKGWYVWVKGHIDRQHPGKPYPDKK